MNQLKLTALTIIVQSNVIAGQRISRLVIVQPDAATSALLPTLRSGQHFGQVLLTDVDVSLTSTSAELSASQVVNARRVDSPLEIWMVQLNPLGAM
jgi:hypothetical protein